MFERVLGNLPSASGSFEVPGLDEIGFMHVFEGVLVLLNRGGKGLDPDRASPELVDNGEEDLAVHLVESCRIDTQPG